MTYWIIYLLTRRVPGGLGKAVGGNSRDAQWQDGFQGSSYSCVIIHPPALEKC